MCSTNNSDSLSVVCSGTINCTMYHSKLSLSQQWGDYLLWLVELEMSKGAIAVYGCKFISHGRISGRNSTLVEVNGCCKVALADSIIACSLESVHGWRVRCPTWQIVCTKSLRNNQSPDPPPFLSIWPSTDLYPEFQRACQYKIHSSTVDTTKMMSTVMTKWTRPLTTNCMIFCHGRYHNWTASFDHNRVLLEKIRFTRT